MQNISGQISGGRYRISGNISTSDELSYWYVNENGEGITDSVPANSSKINFIEDNEESYLNIITYRYTKKAINEKYEKERTMESKEWREYVFYLPASIMQYELE